jgi:hypothetical protein
MAGILDEAFAAVAFADELEIVGRRLESQSSDTLPDLLIGSIAPALDGCKYRPPGGPAECRQVTSPVAVPTQPDGAKKDRSKRSKWDRKEDPEVSETGTRGRVIVDKGEAATPALRQKRGGSSSDTSPASPAPRPALVAPFRTLPLERRRVAPRTLCRFHPCAGATASDV